MRRRSRPASKKDSIRSLVDTRIDEGSDGAYEALQLLRGQVQRAIKANQGVKALETARDGTLALLRRGFVAKGTEMAYQLIDVFQASEIGSTDGTAASTPLDLELDQCLSALEAVDAAYYGGFAVRDGDAEARSSARRAASSGGRGKEAELDMIPNENKTLGRLEKFRLLYLFHKATIKWSSKRKAIGAYLLGEPRLHALAGRACWYLACTAAAINAEDEGSGVVVVAQDKGNTAEGKQLLDSLAHVRAACKHIVLGEKPLQLAYALCSSTGWKDDESDQATQAIPELEASAAATAKMGTSSDENPNRHEDSTVTFPFDVLLFGTIAKTKSSTKQAILQLRAQFVLISVLQFLAVENLRDANIFFAAVTSQKRFPGAFASTERDKTHVATGSSSSISNIYQDFPPPLTAAGLLLQMCQRDVPDLFLEFARDIDAKHLAVPSLPLKKGRSGAEIREQFAKDKALANGMIKTIGDKFFGLKPPPNMMDMVMAMFKGGDDDE